MDFVYWTLEIEVFFYAWIFCLWAIGALKRPLISLGAWVILACINELLTSFVGRELPWFLAHVLLLDYIPYFAIGGAAWVLQTGSSGERRWAWALIGLSLLTLGVSDGLYDLSSGPENAAIATLFTAIMLLATSGRSRVLSSSCFVFLGAISFPLYLLHQNIGYGLMLRLKAAGLSGLTLTLAALIAAILLSWIVHRWIELPATRATRRFGERRYQQWVPASLPIPTLKRRWVAAVLVLAVIVVAINRLLKLTGS